MSLNVFQDNGLHQETRLTLMAFTLESLIKVLANITTTFTIARIAKFLRFFDRFMGFRMSARDHGFARPVCCHYDFVQVRKLLRFELGVDLVSIEKHLERSGIGDLSPGYCDGHFRSVTLQRTSQAFSQLGEPLRRPSRLTVHDQDLKFPIFPFIHDVRVFLLLHF